MDKLLKIKQIGDFNEYILQEEKTKKTYRLVLEFYGLKPEVNDILMLNEKLLDPKSEWATYFYVFEELKKTEANLAEVDLAEIIIKDKKHILKRVYG